MAPQKDGRDVISIPIPSYWDYYTLKQRAVKGGTVGQEIDCPQCHVVGVFIFTGRWVKRGIVWSKGGKNVYEIISIPLARGLACGHQLRVLPVEIASHMRFSLSIKGEACCRHISNLAAGEGLRTVAKETKGERFHFTTLHRWLAQMGRRTLDRVDHGRAGGEPGGKLPEAKTGLPTAAVITETAKGLVKNVSGVWTRHYFIAPKKYRSARRHDELKACARLLATAALLFSREGSYPLTAWRAWLLMRSLDVGSWPFAPGNLCTASQLPPPGGNRLKSSGRPKTRRKEANHGTRSPPGSSVEI
ncbi:MAG: hypothetical protein AAB403_09220 [Planctomycetota bacterium]